jgi:hypothetical protein
MYRIVSSISKPSKFRVLGKYWIANSYFKPAGEIAGARLAVRSRMMMCFDDVDMVCT